ncbi:hypothetical protein EDD16DRAFT_1525735 [Pisolithus croceorrhizus]|nr:hypothetical protein EDD16DRAFT_1525735 [Pisolithus croceorrhizus]KAI6137851.1 hypothetical protein EDD17DRAFT_1517035 [Pisolithus thermaeus]
MKKIATLHWMRRDKIGSLSAPCPGTTGQKADAGNRSDQHPCPSGHANPSQGGKKSWVDLEEAGKVSSRHLQTGGEIIGMEGLRLKLDPRDCFLDQPGCPEVPNETFNAFGSGDNSNDNGLASSGKYNCMTLERAQKDICTADQFIGHVWLTIQQRSHTPVFKYAMQEDHSHLAGTSEQPLYKPSFDVDLT